MKKAKGHRALQELFKIYSKYFPRALSLHSTEITAGRKLEYTQNYPKGIHSETEVVSRAKHQKASTRPK